MEFVLRLAFFCFPCSKNGRNPDSTSESRRSGEGTEMRTGEGGARGAAAGGGGGQQGSQSSWQWCLSLVRSALKDRPMSVSLFFKLVFYFYCIDNLTN